MGTSEKETLGYPGEALGAWAERARTWMNGGMPSDLAAVAAPSSKAPGRDVFLYVISGFKASNPAAAMGLIERLR